MNSPVVFPFFTRSFVRRNNYTKIGGKRRGWKPLNIEIALQDSDFLLLLFAFLNPF